jgi:16S rRNA (cytosine1402-N4)-methyltransferase
MNYSHIPVMLDEVLHVLTIEHGNRYIDCTFGGGGYSVGIASRGGDVLGLDLDQDAITFFNSRTDIDPDIRSRIRVVQGNFDAVYDHAQKIGFTPVRGVVFDLGVSSYQLDTGDKGFSFMRSGPLDMRMDQSVGATAGKLLDILDHKSLTRIFTMYGDELHARKIAQAVIDARPSIIGTRYWEDKTTADFARLVEVAVGGRKERIHPATRVFQALRMAVNDETGNLERGLRSAWDCLQSGGRIVAVAFHSIEDRIVKDFIEECERSYKGKQVGDVLTPTDKEIAENPRSRSAKMRVVQKL